MSTITFYKIRTVTIEPTRVCKRAAVRYLGEGLGVGVLDLAEQAEAREHVHAQCRLTWVRVSNEGAGEPDP